MKKRTAVWLAIAMGFVLTGCSQPAQSGGWNSDTGSIYINQSGELQSSVVFTSEKDNDTYNQDELKAYAEEAVISYNTDNGAAAAAANSEDGEKLPVALESATIKDKTGKLIFTYKDGDSLVGFARESGDSSNTLTAFSVMKISDAAAAGAFADTTFVNTDGTAVSADEVAGQTDGSVIRAEGSATVCTEGEIVYVSEGVTVSDAHNAQTPEGTNIIVVK